MADYAPWPLWDSSGLIEESQLPLSAELNRRIKRWLNGYDGNRRADWPRWTASSPDQEELEWVAEGEQLAAAIQEELGDPYEVTFEP